MLRSILAAIALTAGMASASAAPMPGIRGVDHIGLTVPDVDAAVTFFTDILGCEKALEFGPFRDDEGTFMADLLEVHPRAVINRIVQLRCGFGANIELFDYDAPDQATVTVRNSDIGGHHIAFYVDDINAAAAYLKENGVKTLLGPLPVDEGPAAGQRILYFFAPWGLQFEAISYPDGMAYESEGGPVLWTPKAPAE